MRLLDKLIARFFPTPTREPVPVLGNSTTHVQSQGGVVMIARFTGVSGFGCSCADTERQIRGVVFAAFDRMRPDALVYDFRDMEYRWGDNLTDTFYYHPDAEMGDEDVEDPERLVAHRSHFPVAYAVSDLNRVGLTSL